MNPFRTPLDPPPKARPLRRPDLTIEQILEWCDAFHKRFGRWPTYRDGPRGLPDTTWTAINTCLRCGLRGLKPGSTLAKFLFVHRGRRHKNCLPPFTPALILKWADNHHACTGAWPTAYSGPILEAPGETWNAVEKALIRGNRGLPGGSSLSRLLAAQRGVRNPAALPRLKRGEILIWADAHHDRTGRWPTAHSGPIPEAPGETWGAVQNALRRGYRGLPKGDSLARLLAQHCGKKNIQAPTPLTIRQILAWADTHHARTGKWPTTRSGPIPEALFETWLAVDGALRAGRRGLRGDSLARLLTRTRGVRNHNAPSRLSIEQIQRWVQAHYRRTGCWPKQKDGPIPNTQGETWSRVAVALSNGRRGLPGGSSLAQVVATLRAKSPGK